jgi:formylglycine-generating enzyme required for sulfatase activity
MRFSEETGYGTDQPTSFADGQRLGQKNEHGENVSAQPNTGPASYYSLDNKEGFWKLNRGEAIFSESVWDYSGLNIRYYPLLIGIGVGGGTGNAPAIKAETLPNGAPGTPYSKTLTAIGDIPITWSLDGGTELPAGLSLDEKTGIIAGTPTKPEVSTFTVKAENPAGYGTRQFSITIATDIPFITTDKLPSGMVGTAYNRTLAAIATGGITWSIESGALPAGLSLAENGTISGTPTTKGTSSFTVKAANSAGSDTKEFSITIISLIEMVKIKSGTFTMGSPTTESNRAENESQHPVTLTQGFYIGKYPVTQAQYQDVTGGTPSFFTNPVSPETSTANRPVERVSWYNAIIFCNRLSMLAGLSPAYEMQTEANTSVWSTDPGTWGGHPTTRFDDRWNAVRMVSNSTGYRLPTEAQWEYACRAGTTTAYNLGNNWSGDWGWYGGSSEGNSGGRTHTVGDKMPNEWGLYDMHGNVDELCWDWFGNYNVDHQTDPTGPASGNNARVTRGGSWNTSVTYVRFLRSAYRGTARPSFTSNTQGFRLVRPDTNEG